jgi:hypothetical protein
MKASFPRVLVRPVLFLASMSPVLAHPGHDDGHELTWDLTHLATHPFATAAWVLILAAVSLTSLELIQRASALRTQSFRGSQPSRGK